MDIKIWKSQIIHWITLKPIINKLHKGKELIFYKNEKYHNIEFPARIIFGEHTITYKYYDNGELHRLQYDNKYQPSVIERYINGDLKSIKFHDNGRHVVSENMPFHCMFRINKSNKCIANHKEFKLSNRRHKFVRIYNDKTFISMLRLTKTESGTTLLHHNSQIDQPAFIVIKNNIILKEEYYNKGKLHRNPSNLPARIHRYDNGDIKKVSYYINGVKQSPPAKYN